MIRFSTYPSILKPLTNPYTELSTTSARESERITVTSFFLGLPFLSVSSVYLTVSTGETFAALRQGFIALIITVMYENTAAPRSIHAFK